MVKRLWQSAVVMCEDWLDLAASYVCKEEPVAASSGSTCSRLAWAGLAAAPVA